MLSKLSIISCKPCKGYIFPLAHRLLRALAAVKNAFHAKLCFFIFLFITFLLPDQGVCAAPAASRTCFLEHIGFSQLHRGNLLSITVPNSLGPALSAVPTSTEQYFLQNISKLAILSACSRKVDGSLKLLSSVSGAAPQTAVSFKVNQ